MRGFVQRQSLSRRAGFEGETIGGMTTQDTTSLNAADILIFVVDDDRDTRSNLRDILEMEGYTVADAASARELFALPAWDQVSVILLDRKLPDGEPDVILPQLLHRAPQASVMMVTGYADVDSAVSALRHGAADYIIKPINPAALLASVRREVSHQSSQRQLHALFENALSGLLIFNSQGIIINANPAACHMLRMEPEKLLGRTVNSLVATTEDDEPPQDFVRPQSAYGEVQLRRGDGSVIEAERQTMLNYSPGLSALSLRDVTERKQSERRALQAERLAAIGETMTALVHESRNALQRSSACLEMLALEVEDRPGALDLVRRTQRAQNQLRDLYEEVRQWAAPVNLLRERTNLASVWREAWQQAMHPFAGRQLELRETIACEPVCRVDASKLNQVFRNIFENAIEASPSPGVIELHCNSCSDAAKGELHISILDHGPGLTLEQRNRIFEPFFTTKAKGTGLGMAIAKRIIMAHHGHIAVDSPDGARIAITLPRGTT